MSSVLSQYLVAVRGLAHIARHPRHQAFVLAVVVIVVVGMAFYSYVEGWSPIDSFYFTVVALSTIGFGDLVPTSEGSRLFTAVYALLGVGIIGTAVHLVVVNAQQVVLSAHGDDASAQQSADTVVQ